MYYNSELLSALIPPPPAANAPPPSHPNAALVPAAPDKVEIAVPVYATPRALKVAPAPELQAATFASTSAFLISCCFVLKFSTFHLF